MKGRLSDVNQERRNNLESLARAMALTSAGRWQATAGASNVTVSDRIYIYHTSANGLSHGTSLGNAAAWMTSKGNGDMESLFSVEIGREVIGSIAINYYSPTHQYALINHRQTGQPQEKTLSARTPLPPVRHGEFHFHPAYQQRSMTIVGSVEVMETLFVPRRLDFDDAAAVFHVVRLSNSSIAERKVTVLGALHLPGTTTRDIEGCYDEDARALVAWNQSRPDWVRAFGMLPDADAHAITLDVEETYYPTGPQDNRTRAVGEAFGTVEQTVVLAPGESKVVSFLTVFSPRGREDAISIYRRYSDCDRAFRETMGFYHEHLMVSVVTTPDLMLNQGAQWSKANMLRVLHKYPFGCSLDRPAEEGNPSDGQTPSSTKKGAIGFTNDPGRGSNLVVRDTAWFTFGCDFLIPEVSQRMLETIAGLQEESGKIIEYWNGIDGTTQDYGLNINDNTPLYVCAVGHHALSTGNTEFARRLYPTIEKASRYILSQRDDQGLVRCTATGTGVYGIAGWRNIIDDRTISGAVTEINSECFAALYVTGAIAEMLGHLKEGDEFVEEAMHLREAINKQLKNPKNGLYYLTSNVDGYKETTVTADLVFPMIFQVADDETTGLIMQRLMMPDFKTAAGLRTLSSKNPLYRPDSYVGLLGGVWPGVTWWFALACARYDSSLIVDALVSSYQHYLREPGTYNTVPGQFSEWFDGETLINRGMRLSPWEPPRYFWAVLEGAMGLGTALPEPSKDRNGDPKARRASVKESIRSQNRISPIVPEGWQWFALNNVPRNQERLSYFAVRMVPEEADSAPRLYLFGVGTFESHHPIRYFKEDRSEEIYSFATDIAAFAFAGEVGATEEVIVMMLGSMSNEARIVPLQTGHLFDPVATYNVRVYVIEQGGWKDSAPTTGDKLVQFASQVEAYEFQLWEFRRQPG